MRVDEPLAKGDKVRHSPAAVVAIITETCLVAKRPVWSGLRLLNETEDEMIT